MRLGVGATAGPGVGTRRVFRPLLRLRATPCSKRSSRCVAADLARFLAVGLVLATFRAHPATPSERDLADLTLEELGNIEITSVSRKPERLGDAAASVFVITAEDIRRSGVTSLPEALRLAPNLLVAQTNASGYSISARGFNSTAGNKLLVLIDGRSVYTPLFSGVFWDMQDVMLEDVERIEVISGPGGTVWGTNAVNGVINVITRSAKDTQGALIAAGGGNTETDGAVRYGGTFGEAGHYRIYGKYFDRDHTSTANGSAVKDAWYKSQAGFRADWGGGSDQFTAQGDAYGGSEQQPAPGDVDIAGMNLIARWGHRLEGGSSLTLQTYYDHTERDIPGSLDDTLDTLDVQFQHSFQPAVSHAVVWGGEYRYGMDRVVNGNALAFLPPDVDQKWASLFAQDEIALSTDLRLTLGARVERNDYTGNEFLPNARLAWKFAPDHLLWTAASRTVRAPSRIDRDLFTPPNPPFLLAGGPDFRSEVADVYEVGYRGQPAPRISYSVTVFHTVYDHLRTLEPAPGGTSLVFGNDMDGTTTGVEMWGSYAPLPIWRLSAGFTALTEDLQIKPGSTALSSSPSSEGNDPAQTWQVRSTLDLPRQCEFDFMVRHVSALPQPVVPAYVAVDVRLGWKPRRDLELSLTGRNLFDSGHAEFGAPLTRSEFGRSVFLKAILRFK
jgi:iron complex outermembrane receptor protein